MKRITFILIVLYVNLLFGSTPNIFILKSTSATVTGPENGIIVSANGSAFTVQCEIIKNQLVVKSYECGSQKLISREIFEIVVTDGVGVASNVSGNIKYFLDFKNNTFYQGQVNVALEQGCIITKTSIGKIVY